MSVNALSWPVQLWADWAGSPGCWAVAFSLSCAIVYVASSMGGGGSRGLWGGGIVFAWVLGFGVGCLGGRLVHWGW